MFSPLKRRKCSFDPPSPRQPIIHLASSRDITLQALDDSLDNLPHQTLKSILLSVLPNHPQALANFQSLYTDFAAEQAAKQHAERRSSTTDPYSAASWDALALCGKFPMTSPKIRDVAEEINADLMSINQGCMLAETTDIFKSGLGTCMLIGKAIITCQQKEAKEGMRLYGTVGRLAVVMGDIAERALQIGDEVYDGVVEDRALIDAIKWVIDAMADDGWGGFERVLVALVQDDDEDDFEGDSEEDEKEQEGIKTAQEPKCEVKAENTPVDGVKV